MEFFSRDILSTVKYGAYIINLDVKQSKWTHWVSLFVDRNTAVLPGFFWNWVIPQEVLY